MQNNGRLFHEQRDSSVSETSIKQTRRFNGGVNNVQSSLSDLTNDFNTHSVVKSIQHGTINDSYASKSANGSKTFTINTSPVNLDKSVIIHNFQITREDGRTSSVIRITDISLTGNSIAVSFSYTVGNMVVFNITGDWTVLEFN